MKAVSSGKRSAEAQQSERFREAVRAHQEGDIDKAESLYLYLLKINPNDALVTCNYAVLLKSRGRLSESQDYFERSLLLEPDSPSTLHNYANLLSLLRQHEKAAQLEQHAIRIYPSSVDQYLTLSECLRKLGQTDEAIRVLKTAVSLNAKHPAALYLNLGSCLHELGRFEEAEAAYRKAIIIDSSYSKGYRNLASLYSEYGRIRDALLVYQQASEECVWEDCESLLTLGSIYESLGYLNDAEGCVRRAVALDAACSDAHVALSRLYLSRGEASAAKREIQTALQLDSTNGHAYFIWSLQASREESDETLKSLSSFNEDQIIGAFQKIQFYFAKASFYHKTSQYELASDLLRKSNDMKLQRYPSDCDNEIKQSRELSEFSMPRRLSTQTSIMHPQVIFIVGMPRSGSTLVESVLSLNPDVQDLGESRALPDAFEICKLGIQKSEAMSLEAVYFSQLRIGSNVRYLTDKNLKNYMYAGLISQRFSSPKIIHCKRGPLDNILSIYRANFQEGHRYASSITDCARVLLNQDELMCHYKQIHSEKIFTLDYDSLVFDPDRIIRELVNWLGWDWDEIYLSPHLNPRIISTASLVQARSPINARSVGGWRHYQELLKPAQEFLLQSDQFSGDVDIL